jgi:hypothetical protein
MGVRKLSDNGDFTPEALLTDRDSQLRRKDLDRDGALVLVVEREKDGAAAAGTDLPVDPVSAL